MTVTVEFINVGRGNLCWTDEIRAEPEPDGDAIRLIPSDMVRSIHRHGALVSRGIDFDDEGGIYVGLRRVGTFRASWLPESKEGAK